ncbi:MAG TPA: BMP family ABC transporter substrate-binding protein [Micromonosporaceae bacterium]|nr:BMP family ABC transporter substrate-binding protein [Micromonosporaceae bacterium]
MHRHFRAGRISRPRLLAVVAALTVVAAGGLASCGHGSGLKVGLAYGVGGPGDHGFNDEALAGLTMAQRELRGSVREVRALSARANESEGDQFDRLTLLCNAGYDPVIAVGYTYAGADPADGPLARAAKACPKTRFAIIDSDAVTAPNVANLVFADEQGAYLMGVAAAAKSRTGTIGMVGACPNSLIGRFQAGYQAGATAQHPHILVETGYVSEDPKRCDFTDVAAAEKAANQLYDEGADVVFQVAGGAGIGVFQAANAHSAMAIGVDSDQYETVGPTLRHVIITSEIKRVDLAVFGFIQSVANGSFTRGVRRYDLADGGVSYATSGGQIADLTSRIEVYRKEIISGRIIVPITP